MSESAFIHQLALAYFQPPARYFWRWTEATQIAEWAAGPTICYREELQVVLEALLPTALPPLGAVLLVLSACAEGWSEEQAAADLMQVIEGKEPAALAGLLQVLVQHKEQQPAKSPIHSKETLIFYRNTVLRFLAQVHALPPQLRTGPGKLHLLREVFAGDNDWRALLQNMPLGQQPARRAALLTEWTSGRLDTALQAGPTGPDDAHSHLHEELLCLDRIFQRFPSADLLALHLRTGLDALPQPLPELPADDAADPDGPAPADLLDQLAQDERTCGLAQLTRRLVAGLRVPLHTRSVSELPLGGVADISNRGTFDRLLLSELAHDDLTLLARLAGNEALYLRREAPPTPQLRPRVVLLDTTLRLWGLPRVFGLAAALAWVRQARSGRHPVPVSAYALTGQLAEPLDLDSVDGVLAALERLDVAPHAGPALRRFAAAPPADADVLLITEAALPTLPDFAPALQAAASALHQLLTVDRDGEARLYEYQHGQRHPLGTTRYDLPELLLNARPTRRPRPASPPAEPGALPAFLRTQPHPLLLPTTGLRPSESLTLFEHRVGALGITHVQRVLHCAHRGLGAVELLPFVESGSYHFGLDADGTVYLLVGCYLAAPVLYTFRPHEPVPLRVELPDASTREQPLNEARYLDGCFYLRFGDANVVVFDCRRQQVQVRHHGPLPEGARYPSNRSQLRRFINPGYSVLQRVESLRLDDDWLYVDSHALHLQTTASGTARLMLAQPPRRTVSRSVRATLLSQTTAADNPRVHLAWFGWPDGSLAVADSRGLLHLRSADDTLPELTIPLVLGHATAAWASDGRVCGAEYFTGRPTPASTAALVPDFYQHYIRPYLERITMTE